MRSDERYSPFINEETETQSSKKLAQGNITIKWEIWDLNPEPSLLTIGLNMPGSAKE